MLTQSDLNMLIAKDLAIAVMGKIDKNHLSSYTMNDLIDIYTGAYLITFDNLEKLDSKSHEHVTYDKRETMKFVKSLDLRSDFINAEKPELVLV